MLLRPLAAFALLAATASPALAQHDHTQAGSGAAIAALTTEQIAQLRAGEGMGLAKAAELNHYPGPKHVLDLATDLGLTDDQAGRLRAIQTRMREQAVRLGDEIIEQEIILDRRFRNRHVSDDVIRASTSEIAQLQGSLRAAHLVAHLETAAILTPAQIARYAALRGYEKK